MSPQPLINPYKTALLFPILCYNFAFILLGFSANFWVNFLYKFNKNFSKNGY